MRPARKRKLPACAACSRRPLAVIDHRTPPPSARSLNGWPYAENDQLHHKKVIIRNTPQLYASANWNVNLLREGQVFRYPDDTYLEVKASGAAWAIQAMNCGTRF